MPVSSATAPLQSPLIQEYVARSQWRSFKPDADELDALVRTALLPSLEAWAARDGFTLRNPEMEFSAGQKYSVRVGVSDLWPVKSKPPPDGWTRDPSAYESKYSSSFHFRGDTRVVLYGPAEDPRDWDVDDSMGLFD